MRLYIRFSYFFFVDLPNEQKNENVFIFVFLNTNFQKILTKFNCSVLLTLFTANNMLMYIIIDELSNCFFFIGNVNSLILLKSQRNDEKWNNDLVNEH